MAGQDMPSQSEERPRLRPLEAFSVEQDGQRVVGLRDPAGFTHQVALLPMPLLDLVSLFDGDHTVEEMQAILRDRHGEAPTAAEIAGVIDRLDEGGFLDSPRFAEQRRAIEEAFRQSPVRPAAHAGGAYAGQAAALRAQIDSFFHHLRGPISSPLASPPAAARQTGPRHAQQSHQASGPTVDHLQGPRNGPRTPPAADAPGGGYPRGLIAPHIDFHRGGPTYAWAYRELAEAPVAPDLFVILGTCHAGMADPFAATLKPYETPLGAAPVDRDFFEALQRRYGHDLRASEDAHRIEHSIEFQAVMLRHLFGERPFTILPVLASFLHEAVWTKSDPERDPRIPRFIDALLGTMAACRRPVCLIAGVDLAHVGPRFGDPEPNTEEALRDVEAADRSMLESVMEGDPIGFYGAVSFDGDSRRICGLSPIYTFLRALPGVRGRLLRYRQWPDSAGAVSFCAAVFP